MWVLGAELGPSGSEASTVSNEPLAYPSESLSFFLFSFDRIKGWLQSFYAAKDDRELSSLSFMPPYTQSSRRFEGSGRPSAVTLQATRLHPTSSLVLCPLDFTVPREPGFPRAGRLLSGSDWAEDTGCDL